MLKIDVEPIAPKLLNNGTAHSYYLKHTQEQVAILREVVEQGKSQNPLNNPLHSTCKYTKRIQELLIIIGQTYPSINNSSDKLVAVTPKNKDKKVRFTELVTSTGITNTKIASSSNLVSNKPMLSSTGVNRLLVLADHNLQEIKRKIRFNKHQHPKLNANSELLCVKCNGCTLYDDHDLCVLDFINDMNARTWRPTRRTFTIVGNACPLTRITTTAEVPLRKPTALKTDTPKLVVTLVYSRKPRKSKTNHLPLLMNAGHPNCSLIGNVTISRVYYVEGLGHNLFSVRQFCDSNLEVAFLQHTCFIRNLDGVDLLTGSQGNNMYTLSLRDMMASSPICLLSKASKTKRIIKAIHVDFDELTAMAFEHSSLEPALHEMTPAIISLGLVPNPHPLTSFVPPSRTDWDILFQPLFDELLNPPSSVDHPFPEAIAPIAKVVAPEPAVSTDSPSSTIIDQDAPSPSNSQTTPETQSPAISNDIEEENHDLDVAHMNNDPFFSIPILENDSKASSSSNVIPTILHTAAPNSEHVTKWTKDYPLDNIIGKLDRPVSTRFQLHEQALFCYYDALLTSFEPKNYKDALTQACWIEAMQEELKEFERLEVWELVPRLDKVMAITLKWIYKVKLDELGGILKNKARLVSRG
ncbi:integrase, catalytic region, zinc finger, CCHC-type containing protein, partial [Tanacetum coccineum]